MVDSHQAELEEETRVEASQAYNILVELEQEGKITSEKAEMYKQKFFVLHKACIKNMENERKLSEKISQLKKVRKRENGRFCRSLSFLRIVLTDLILFRLFPMRRLGLRRLSSKRLITSTS